MRRFGLIGRNIGYSFSRGYFSEKFRALGLVDHSYENFDLESIDRFPELLEQTQGLAGLNVTIPYKEAILPYLDRLDPVAADIGAVNTICFENGQRVGYNTDAAGFGESIRPLLRPADQKALILGTGGASKAVAYVLGQLGLAPQFVSRNPAPDQLEYAQLEPLLRAGTTVIVNGTPLGTHPDTDRCPPIPYDALGPDHLLYDLIYNPPETEFLRRGRLAGSRTKNGLQMLEIQAEHAWTLWNR